MLDFLRRSLRKLSCRVVAADLVVRVHSVLALVC